MHTKKVRRKDENLKFRIDTSVCAPFCFIPCLWCHKKCISTYRAIISKHVLNIYMTYYIFVKRYDVC